MTIMSHERVVLTDTASSLSQVEADRFGVKLIPFHIIWSDQEFTDFTITPKEMYRRIDTHGIPSTSGPIPDDFFDSYKELYQQGAKNILSIHLGVRSMTLNNAVAAGAKMEEKYPDVKIDVINSKSLTIAQQHKVLRAKELFDQGKSAEEINIELETMASQMVLFGSTGQEAIPFLKKSGRLNG
jgi:DegV family protein with EDD domain